ncbi:MAG TPA: hypothetical protein VI195_08120 [Steroidobacteraceae bacterium]
MAFTPGVAWTPGLRTSGVAVDPAWVHARTATGKNEAEIRARMSIPSACRPGPARLTGRGQFVRRLFLVLRRWFLVRRDIGTRRDAAGYRRTLTVSWASEGPLVVE